MTKTVVSRQSSVAGKSLLQPAPEIFNPGTWPLAHDKTVVSLRDQKKLFTDHWQLTTVS
jgi:hypothetical protein